MAQPFKGVVNLDIRDSTPDWEPFLQPQAPAGAPNVLMIVWDDVGYGAMDVFGGPIPDAGVGSGDARLTRASTCPVDDDQ